MAFVERISSSEAVNGEVDMLKILKIDVLRLVVICPV